MNCREIRRRVMDLFISVLSKISGFKFALTSLRHQQLFALYNAANVAPESSGEERLKVDLQHKPVCDMHVINQQGDSPELISPGLR